MSTATARQNGPKLNGAAADGERDALPWRVEAAQTRADGLVRAMSAGAKAEVRAMRDELDGLERVIEQHENALEQAIADHATLVASVYDVRDIIGPAIGKMRTQFETELARVPRTVTVDRPAASRSQH